MICISKQIQLNSQNKSASTHYATMKKERVTWEFWGLPSTLKHMHILISENPNGWICTLNQPPLCGDGYISHNT
jgi:hypothetical protein